MHPTSDSGQVNHLIVFSEEPEREMKVAEASSSIIQSIEDLRVREIF